jgi:hypothetical protein
MCNLTNYLMEEELSCRRIAQVANLDTPAGMEWLRVAGEILRIRREHLGNCKLCQQTPSAAVIEPASDLSSS